VFFVVFSTLLTSVTLTLPGIWRNRQTQRT